MKTIVVNLNLCIFTLLLGLGANAQDFKNGDRVVRYGDGTTNGPRGGRVQGNGEASIQVLWDAAEGNYPPDEHITYESRAVLMPFPEVGGRVLIRAPRNSDGSIGEVIVGRVTESKYGYGHAGNSKVKFVDPQGLERELSWGHVIRATDQMSFDGGQVERREPIVDVWTEALTKWYETKEGMDPASAREAARGYLAPDRSKIKPPPSPNLFKPDLWALPTAPGTEDLVSNFSLRLGELLDLLNDPKLVQAIRADGKGSHALQEKAEAVVRHFLFAKFGTLEALQRKYEDIEDDVKVFSQIMAELWVVRGLNDKDIKSFFESAAYNNPPRQRRESERCKEALSRAVGPLYRTKVEIAAMRLYSIVRRL